VVVRLLRAAGRHRGWSLAYGWCPLVVKEIANSGHLDSLATCLAMLAVWFVVSAIFVPSEQHRRRWKLAIAAAVALGCGVGAKLFPVVLAPLLLWMLAKRVSWMTGLVSGLLFLAVSHALLWPMRPTGTAASPPFDEAEVVAIPSNQPPLPPAEVSTMPRDPSESLRAFLSRWEMNDFLFLLVIENLRPSTGLPPEQVAWFTVTPESWRQSLVASVATTTGVSPDRAPFTMSRLLLGGLFVILSCVLACRAVSDHESATSPTPTPEDTANKSAQLAQHCLNAAFLTLAWFWLLLPTQNPWYLTWAMPLLPFARSRAWLALSGLTFVYYVRFWMTAQFPSPLLGTSYSGAQFFDFVVTWLEFAPWLVWLTITRFASTR